MSDHKYDNAVGPNNAYGHCLQLLDRNVPRADGAVHLDLACGLAPIAEFVIDSHGVQYVGVDFDQPSVAAVQARGHEAHVGDLNDPDVESFLEGILAGRRLASVSMLDGLEHLVDGIHVVRAISSLLGKHQAVCVLSVPNVTHVDVGIKNLLGRWDYTPSGLLDETHYRLYSPTSLEEMLSQGGLAKIDEFDVVMAESDQHFPEDHGALVRDTPLGQFLRGLRDRADHHGTTNQFVWVVSPVPPRPQPAPTHVPDPFLSVIMRTQGRRIQELREALLCLAAQSDSDFEVLIVAHRVTVEQQLAIERTIEDQPAAFRRRIRLLLLDVGGRAAPLNLGLREARGRYVVVFDDDDLVLGSWVGAFHESELVKRGRILRSQSVSQEVIRQEIRGLTAIKGHSSPNAQYAAQFSLLQHLTQNHSPAHSWAYPRTLNRDFGMVYDETMTTTEDWEFLLRGAELVGVTDVPKVTAIYHWWTDHESSRTSHSQDEWKQNHTEVERRMDSRPLLLPAGETRRLRQLAQFPQQVVQVSEELRLTHQHARNLERLVARLERQAKNRDRVSRRRQRKLETLKRRLSRKNQQLRRTRADLRRANAPKPSLVTRVGRKTKSGVARLLRR